MSEEMLTREICEQRAEDLRHKADHTHCNKCANAHREIANYWDGQALIAPTQAQMELKSYRPERIKRMWPR